ncbi:hotdog domain-containing protein [Mycetocola sp. 2940]|uniref:acyl-CoA thioesterase n=1 Tax=Mycetocola sp. 2940 TaxID=3156452 RepID=UPI0033973BA9
MSDRTEIGLAIVSSSTTSPPADRISLRFLAAPTEVTSDGSTIQAGRVLEWIDKAGYACAVGWSGSYCVTAYVGNVHFTRPITPGSLIEADARIIHTGRSSMHVLVTVRAADARRGEFRTATHCILVFVAVDDDKRPVAVPEWRPATDDDRRVSDGAVVRIDARRRIHEEMQRNAFGHEGTAPRTVFRFLAAPTDSNWGGNAHGGTVMRWIDEAASTCAIGWTGKDAVAVYAGGIHFYRPIHIGHIVEVEARIIHTSERSIHLSIQVHSADPRTRESHLTTQCMSIFVSVGTDGRAARVPQLVLSTDEDERLNEHAKNLITLRAALPAFPLAKS